MTKKTNPPFQREVAKRAVRLVLEHRGEHSTQWAAIGSVAGKIGCSGESLRDWVRQAERDSDARADSMSAEGKRLKAMEQENRELR